MMIMMMMIMTPRGGPQRGRCKETKSGGVAFNELSGWCWSWSVMTSPIIMSLPRSSLEERPHGEEDHYY